MIFKRYISTIKASTSERPRNIPFPPEKQNTQENKSFFFRQVCLRSSCNLAATLRRLKYCILLGPEIKVAWSLFTVAHKPRLKKKLPKVKFNFVTTSHVLCVIENRKKKAEFKTIFTLSVTVVCKRLVYILHNLLHVFSWVNRRVLCHIKQVSERKNMAN